MSCGVGDATEGLYNELWRSRAHSPTFPSLYLRNSSFYNPSVASPTPQLIHQVFIRFSCVTGSSLTSPGELSISDIDIFRSVVPTFQYPRHRNQPPVLSANSLHWSAAHCAKMLSSYDHFIRGKRWKSQRAKPGRMMVGDQTLPIENASGASFCCSCSMRPSIAMKKVNTWGQHSSSLDVNKGIELQHALHIWRETIVLDMFTGSLRAQNWQVRCVAIDEHTRDIAQHIYAKLHLILTVVVISRPIGPWKSNSPRTT